MVSKTNYKGVLFNVNILSFVGRDIKDLQHDQRDDAGAKGRS
jgi:hypothetical protein